MYPPALMTIIEHRINTTENIAELMRLRHIIHLRLECLSTQGTLTKRPTGNLEPKIDGNAHGNETPK